jgi:hypothetical protein
VLAGIGLTQEQICAVKGISRPTLAKYYTAELDSGEACLNAEVGRNLYRIATSDKAGAVTAAIFWMKTRAGWREVKHPETPPTIESMSDKQLEAILIEQLALQSARPMKLIEGKKQKA